MIIERLTSHLQTTFALQPNDARLSKYTVFTMMTIMESTLAQSLSLDVATVVMHELIMLTILYSAERGEQMLLLMRAINAAVVSYTENANPTLAICFMVKINTFFGTKKLNLLYNYIQYSHILCFSLLLQRFDCFIRRLWMRAISAIPTSLFATKTSPRA